MTRPNCNQCRHFYITWDKKNPNGCRKFGILCKDSPSSVIAQAGLGDCLGFEEKGKKPKEKVLDLNRKDLW